MNIFARLAKGNRHDRATSLYGRWFAAGILGQIDELDHYAALIHERYPSGGEDQFAVVKSAFDSIVKLHFDERWTEVMIDEFIDEFLTMPLQNSPERNSVKAAIMRGVGRKVQDPATLDASQLLMVYAGAGAVMARKMALSARKVEALVFAAEQDVESKGLILARW